MQWLIRLLLLVGGIALLAVLGWAFWPSPLLVETAWAQRQHFEETILEDGQTRVRERYVVAAPLAGTLLRVELKAGDQIEAGAEVASILPNRPPLLDLRARQEAEQRLGAAEAAMARASAVMARLEGVAEQARVDADRSRTLVARDAAPHTRLENDELALRTALQELDAAHSAQHQVILFPGEAISDGVRVHPR
jgi:HlyD family secretion protein